ncbi:tape measure protein [Xanthomonas phage Seregon]|nr:tape measure protein [Xanthomonas phage Seregon]
MAAQNEVELIVRAKNLSTRTINQLNDELSKIADNQEQVADANRLAERSFESLKSEQQQLLAIMKSLNDRASKLDAYSRQEQQVRSLRDELSRARDNLNTLAQEFYKTEKPSKEFTQQLKTAASEVTKLESSLRNNERRLETTGTKLRDMGVDVTRFSQSQAEVNQALNSSVSLYKRSTDNVERYDAAVKEVRTTQQQAREAERAAAQEARDSATKLEQAAREREDQMRREQKMAELTANVYRTLAREKEKAAQAGAQFRAGGTQALAAARAAAVPAVGSGSAASGAAAGVQALLDPAKDAVATLDRLEKAVDQLDEEFKALTPDALQAADGIDKLADQSRRLRAAADALKGQAGLADELNRQNTALLASQQRFEEARQEVIQYAQAVERADKPNDELAASLQRAQNEMKQAHGELTRQTEAFNRVQQRAAAAGITLNNLTGIEQRLAQAATRVRTGQEQVAQTMTRLEQTTAKTNTQLKLFNDGQRTALSLYQRTRGQVLSLVSAYVGVFGALNLVNSAMDAALERERVMSRLLIANKGNQTAAAEEYDYLRKKADELGAAFGPLSESYSRFAVAARDAGMSTEATRYIFEAFTEAATAMRLSGDETAGAFRALEQIFSKGFIQAEELRGQLGDRMTGAFNLFAKAIGVTTQELNNMLEKGGEVKAEFVLLAAQTARGIYGPQAKAASNSLLGDLNRMQNAWGDLKREIIDGGLGDALRRLFVDLTKYLKSDDGKKFAENLTKVFVAAADAGGELLKVLAENDEIIKLVADTVAFLIKNFKALLAIMLAIQGARIAMVFTSLATEILKARAATLALNTALGAGTAASAGRAGVALGGLISGPIAAILAIAAAGIIIPIYFQMKGELESNKVKVDAQKTINDLNRGFEVSQRSLSDTSKTNAEQLERQVTAASRLLEIYDKQKESLQAQIRENTAVRRNQVAVRVAQGTREHDMNFPAKQLAAVREVENEGKALEAQLAALEQRAAPLRQQVAAASRQIGETKAREAAAENDALAAEFKRIQAAADAAAARAGTDAKAAKAAEAARKKAEAEEKRLAALAERRLRLEEDVAEKLRDIDNDIANSRPDTLEARLAVIDNKIADRKAELERMLREADKLGQSDAAKGEIQRGINSLPELQKAQQQATTQEFYEQRINDLLQQRQSSMDAINTLQEAGLLTTTEAATRIEEVNARLLPQLEALRAKAAEFMATLGDGPQAQAARASLENLSAQIQAMSVELSAQKRQVIDVFVNGFGQAFMETATLISDTLKGVQDAGDAWKAFGDIVLNTIADILIQLAQMIIQQAIFNALKAAAENSGGGWGQIISAVASYLHVGGLAGSGSGRRSSVPAYVFEAAPRYHTGGVAGLAPDEVPAVLKRNEEVLTEDDPRHRFNGGMAGGAQPAMDVSIINTIDSESVVAAGANTRAGRQSIFNAIKADRSSYKKLLA